MNAILVFFHCGSNTGYAIAPLERTFFQMSQLLFDGDDSRIHFGYKDLSKGFPTTLPASFRNVTEFDPKDNDKGSLARIKHYIEINGIDLAFGFDQGVSQPSYPTLRRAGIKTLISYWGAPMSSVNSGWRLALKRLEVRLRRSGPDHYIFESQAMAFTATNGRGIPPRAVEVVHLGVDCDRYRPSDEFTYYAHNAFGIPTSRRIIVFSGHMEERKGVHVLVKAAVQLCRNGRSDFHLLVLGNQAGQEKAFADLYRGTAAEKHITFGGYRSDIPQIFASCYFGALASTGWDSFTMSAVEMAASGLPLVVSRLQGLAETVEDGETGFLVAPGDVDDLCARIELLLDDHDMRAAMGTAARRRALEQFTRDRQVASLLETVRRVARR